MTRPRGYRDGQRVIAGAITPLGWSNAYRCGCGSQDGAGTAHGWKFGTIDGCQAACVLVPDAMANLAAVPDESSDGQVLMCPDIMSTGFGGADPEIDSSCIDPVEEIMRLAGGRSVDVAIEALGTQVTWRCRLPPRASTPPHRCATTG